jgi:DNA-binding MarR family transcriptional regulator
MAYDDESDEITLPELDDDDKLYHLFARARYLTFRARERELQRYNLTPEQAQVLFVVQALGEKATPIAISRLLLRQPHTVSSILSRMSEKGLLTKTNDLERKNYVHVVITDKGKEAYELTTKRGPIRRIMGSLTKQERKNFRNHLEKIQGKAITELGGNSTQE